MNPFSEQPVKFRLEALMAAGSYDDANNIVLADLSEPNQFAGPPRAADGVTASLAKTSDGVGAGRHIQCHKFRQGSPQRGLGQA